MLLGALLAAATGLLLVPDVGGMLVSTAVLGAPDTTDVPVLLHSRPLARPSLPEVLRCRHGVVVLPLMEAVAARPLATDTIDRPLRRGVCRPPPPTPSLVPLVGVISGVVRPHLGLRIQS